MKTIDFWGDLTYNLAKNEALHIAYNPCFCFIQIWLGHPDNYFSVSRPRFTVLYDVDDSAWTWACHLRDANDCVLNISEDLFIKLLFFYDTFIR